MNKQNDLPHNMIYAIGRLPDSGAASTGLLWLQLSPGLSWPSRDFCRNPAFSGDGSFLPGLENSWFYQSCFLCFTTISGYNPNTWFFCYTKPSIVLSTEWMLAKFSIEIFCEQKLIDEELIFHSEAIYISKGHLYFLQFLFFFQDEVSTYLLLLANIIKEQFMSRLLFLYFLPTNCLA